MKRVIYLLLLLINASFMGAQINLPPAKGYVDLGLPSGTKWKETNEEGFYTFEKALNKYGSDLPSADQWRELQNYCTWEWYGSGFVLTSTFNGNTLQLPSGGFIACNGNKETSTNFGSYWSRDKFWHQSAHAYVAWSIGWYCNDVTSKTIDFDASLLCHQFRVRLVH